MSPSDARGRLTTDPFEHRATKDGTVHISRGGRVVTSVAGAAAARLLAAIAAADGEDAVQRLLARATGNYRRGNERAGRRR
ncbi:MAG: hypothetical protein ACXWYN_10430 [Actinomycetota bacterium]